MSWFGEFYDARVEIAELIDSGDQVFVQVTAWGRGKQSGVESGWHLWHLWTLRDGKIVRGEGFTNRDEALEAVGLQEQAMSEENVESIRHAYERWNQGDFGWATVAAPDIEYVAGGALGLSGHYRGVEAFMRYLEQFWGEFDEARAEPQELIDTGDSVLAVITFRGRGKQSGVAVNMEVFQLWSFRDGKVVRGQAFFDREGALEAAGVRG